MATGRRLQEDGVVLCYDGSSQSVDAIRRAGRLLGPRHALALHVWQAEQSGGNGSPGLVERERERLAQRARLAESVAADGASVALEAGFSAEPLAVRAGESVADAILQTVEKHRPAMVVLGSRGLSDLASALLGSVSTSVVHGCPRPVLVVPPAKS